MPTVLTPTEYRAALREIEYLWGAEPDTDEGQKLKEYLSAVEKYERRSSVKPTEQELA